MKKGLLLGMLLILLAALAGCNFMQSKEEIQKKQRAEQKKKQDMVAYMEKRYNKKFTIDSEFIQIGHAFYSGTNQLVFYVKDKNGIRTLVRARENDRGTYYDDYINDLVAHQYDLQINYKQYPDIKFAKTYPTVDTLDGNDNLDEVMNGNYENAIQKVLSVYSIVYVNQKPSEKVLKELYALYQSLQRLGKESTYFYVGFMGDKKKANEFVKEYLTVETLGTYKWEVYDKSIAYTLKVVDKNLTFNQFKKKLKKI